MSLRLYRLEKSRSVQALVRDRTRLARRHALVSWDGQPSRVLTTQKLLLQLETTRSVIIAAWYCDQVTRPPTVPRKAERAVRSCGPRHPVHLAGANPTLARSLGTRWIAKHEDAPHTPAVKQKMLGMVDTR